MEQQMVPEIRIDAAMTNPDATALAQSDDTATALAAIAREKGVVLDANGNVATQLKTDEVRQIVADTQPQAVETTQVQADAVIAQGVPAKFQNQDGTVNVEK